MNDIRSETIQSGEAHDASPSMTIAIVLRSDLEPWQRLNVPAFIISGVASQEGGVGEDYRDSSLSLYLPMFKGSGVRCRY